MLKYPTTNPIQEFDRQVYINELKFNVPDFRNLKGKDLFKRTHGLQDLLEGLKKHHLILYNKVNMSPPAQECYGLDDYGNIFYGLNFASADYLGLCTCQEAKDAASEVAQEYSVNSCGAPLAFGMSKYYMQLKEELKEFWQMKEIMLFSAGWLAGFGIIKGIMRQDDYIIMDELSHNCLQEGAFAACKNVFRTPHLQIEPIREKLQEIRKNDSEAAILVVTEGLFSMDSDYMDLIALQKLTKEFGAFLMIDSAHDFGCLGENGRGIIEVQGLKDFSNVILMSGGSKCLSTNLGWIAINDSKALEYLKYFTSAYMFTNSVNPVQCSTALAQLRLLKSETGRRMRVKVMENYHYMKKKVNELGFEVIGQPSPICPVLIRNEIVNRLLTRLMLDEGVHVNGIEYPVVKVGQARLRVNLQPQHTKGQMDIFIATLDYCYQKATKIFQISVERFQLEQEQLEGNEEEKKRIQGLNKAKL